MTLIAHLTRVQVQMKGPQVRKRCNASHRLFEEFARDAGTDDCERKSQQVRVSGWIHTQLGAASSARCATWRCVPIRIALSSGIGISKQRPDPNPPAPECEIQRVHVFQACQPRQFPAVLHAANPIATEVHADVVNGTGLFWARKSPNGWVCQLVHEAPETLDRYTVHRKG